MLFSLFQLGIFPWMEFFPNAFLRLPVSGSSHPADTIRSLPAPQRFRPATRFFFLIRKRVAIFSAFWYNRLTQ
jgi:hypothetical protein